MATKRYYKEKIVKELQSLKIYKEEFDLLISVLAQICEHRDKNLEEWEREGNMDMVIYYTNKGGATNISKSPYYLNDLQFNEQILKYCKELCLSPSGLKKLGQSNDDTESDELADFVKQFD